MEDPYNCRKYAVTALVAMGSAAYDPACDLLSDPRPWVREAGATVLGQLGNAQAGEALIGLLADSDPETRTAAITALGKLRISHAIPLLLPLLHDERPLLRKAAAGALGDMGEKMATPALHAAVTDQYLPTRYAAATALAQLGDARGFIVLREGLKSNEYRIPDMALQGLITANPPDLTDFLLASITTSHFEWTVMLELGARKESRAIKPIVTTLLDGDDNGKLAITTLQQITGLPWEKKSQWRCWWELQQQAD